MPKTMTSVTTVLNQQVANWSVMYMKLHNYHWYITGGHFFTLHEKLEELYTEAGQHLDDLAERLLSLGKGPVATMKECLEMSSIQEATGKESPTDMIRTVSKDFETIINEMQEGIKTAEEEEDEPTGDMLIAIQGSLQKHKWMLDAFLK
ncbi:DNA starvation/stationary phase protection protein [Paenibacillus sp. J2TS4]|uniref:Dps family protein n=1 Tax=Paenibacillus sp. J2TS4 TaxID=2807194 RepID=UPI001B2543FA|nr:Dps family protein [Paenibacillus sp. J2TS4]GIP34058.1 DNA starvation/stationary phase protection protein [Paenibacillus sp. J2TS4]